ncbi:MAG: hypothetical protein QXV18_04015 [Candidatus Nitrosocaldus sp.]
MHPSQVPVIHSFTANDVREALNAVDNMLQLYEQYKAVRFRVLLPKAGNAKSIGYDLLNELNLRIRHVFKGNIRYLIYHHDSNYYALLLLDDESANAFMMMI